LKETLISHQSWWAGLTQNCRGKTCWRRQYTRRVQQQAQAGRFCV